MREITGTTKSPSPDGISTSGATQRPSGQVRTKSRRKRSTTGDLANVRGDSSCLVDTGIGLEARSNGRDKGTSRTGGEVAAAGLSDGRGSTDGLANIDAGIGRLVS